MEDTNNTKAIILKRQSYRENDSSVVVYTPDFGKMTLIARGTKKITSKLIGHLEPISLSDIMIVKGKGRHYIGGAICQDAFLNIKDDLNKLYYAGQGIRVFNRLVRDGQGDPDLFNLLKNWLELLDTAAELSKEKGALFLSFFLLRLLNELGYSPELSHCLHCGAKISAGGNYFSLADGGLVGKECYNSGEQLLPISDNAIKLATFILDNTLDKSNKVKVYSKTVKDLLSLLNKLLPYYF